MKTFSTNQTAEATVAFNAARAAGYGRIETTATNIIVYETIQEWNAAHPAPPPPAERYIDFQEFKARFPNGKFQDVTEYIWSRSAVRKYWIDIITSAQIDLNAARLSTFLDAMVTGAVITAEQKAAILA